MNGPVDEIRRLREQLAARDQQIAEMGDLIREHFEATKDDDRIALEREQAAFEAGRNVATRTYEDGFSASHDVGLGANENARPFVAGIREGFQAGRETWQEVAREVFSKRPERELEMG